MSLTGVISVRRKHRSVGLVMIFKKKKSAMEMKSVEEGFLAYQAGKFQSLSTRQAGVGLCF